MSERKTKWCVIQENSGKRIFLHVATRKNYLQAELIKFFCVFPMTDNNQALPPSLLPPTPFPPSLLSPTPLLPYECTPENKEASVWARLPLVVINLDRRQDRLKSFQEHIKTALPFVQTCVRLQATEPGDDVRITNAGQACMMSHARAIKMAQENKWEQVMVLEDDARFTPTCTETIECIFQQSYSPQWKIIFGASVRMNFKCVVGYSSSLFRLRPETGIFTGTHCMIYHSSGYEEILKLIDDNLSSGYHIDLLLCQHIQPILLSVPYLCLFTENDMSDVRSNKDTSSDYSLLIEAHETALHFMNIWRRKNNQPTLQIGYEQTT